MSNNYETEVLARTTDQDRARDLARTLPKPCSIRRGDGDEWLVVRLVPARWMPAAIHGKVA